MSDNDNLSPAEAFAEWFTEQTQPTETPEPAPDPEQAGPRAPRPNMAQGQGSPVYRPADPAQAFAAVLETFLPPRVADGGPWLDVGTGQEVVVSGQVPPKAGPGPKS